jgi:hypothetical protein
MQCLRLQHGPCEKKWKTVWNDAVIYIALVEVRNTIDTRYQSI